MEHSWSAPQLRQLRPICAHFAPICAHFAPVLRHKRIVSAVWAQYEHTAGANAPTVRSYCARTALVLRSNVGALQAQYGRTVTASGRKVDAAGRTWVSV